MDRGHEYTDELIKEMEKKINAEYAKAEKEIDEQLKDYLRRYEIKDKKWQEWVEEGKKTKKEYEAWRTQQLAVGQKWEAQKEMIAEELAHSNEIARQIVNDTTPQIYGYNHDWATWQVEHDAGVNTGYTLYNKDAVNRLMRDDPDLLPPPSERTLSRIARNKETLWNKQQLQSVMMQGILQGDSIPKLATRLSNTVGERNRKAAIRNARTMATGAQNAGRNNAYKRAEKKGIDLEKTWLSTMDNRTRHSHRWIDRETVPMDEDFSNGLEYPADPKGDPAEVYNCRCSMRSEVKGLERRSGKFRDDSAVEHMSYDEWRNAKPKSRDILHQDKVSEAMKRKHIREYGGFGNSTKTKSVPAVEPMALVNKNGREIKIDLGTADNIKDEARRERAIQRRERVTELITGLNNEYDSFIESVSLGAGHMAGNVDAVGNMKLNSLKSEDVLHEFAHTLASSDRIKFDLATDNEKDFMKEVRKLYSEYEKECAKDSKYVISAYSHYDKDEFLAEAFTQAKAREMGIELPDTYGTDYTYAERILELIDRYFKKSR